MSQRKKDGEEAIAAYFAFCNLQHHQAIADERESELEAYEQNPDDPDAYARLYDSRVVYFWIDHHSRKRTENRFIEVVSKSHGREDKASRRISGAPGSGLDHFMRLVVSKKNYERIFSEIASDMRGEYFEALATGRIKTARWILLRFHFSVVAAWVLSVGGLLDVIRKISR